MRQFLDYTFDDVIKFNLPIKDKFSLVSVATSSSVSMALFAYRGFRSWKDSKQMFVFVGGGIFLIIGIWTLVLGISASSIVKKEPTILKKMKKKRTTGGRNNRGSIAAVDINDMFQSMGSGKMTTNDNKNEDEEMDNINAQGTVGFATGEFGLGALAPGLV